MAVQPRVVFTRFSDIDSPELQPWLNHLSRVIGRRATTGRAVPYPTVWQLLTANNREVARSAELFEGFRAARDAAQKTIDGLANSVIRTVVDEGRGLHGWYLSVDDHPQVVCSRWYFADRERTQAVTLAVATLAVATFGDGARLALDRVTKGSDAHVS
jgi:hypothetical protein